MQHTKMYAIFDSCASAYLTPFFYENDLLAMRAFGALVNSPDHLFASNPGDFTLFQVATFGISDGALDVQTAPVRIRSGQALVLKQPNDDQLDLYRRNAAHSPPPVQTATKGEGGYETFNKERAKS